MFSGSFTSSDSGIESEGSLSPKSNSSDDQDFSLPYPRFADDVFWGFGNLSDFYQSSQTNNDPVADNYQQLHGITTSSGMSGLELSSLLAGPQQHEVQSFTVHHKEYIARPLKSVPIPTSSADPHHFVMVGTESKGALCKGFAERLGLSSSSSSSVGECSPMPSITSDSTDDYPMTPNSYTGESDCFFPEDIQSVLLPIKEYVMNGGAEAECQMQHFVEESAAKVNSTRMPVAKKTTRRSSGKKKPRLYHFLLEVLDTEKPGYGKHIVWLNQSEKTFKIINSGYIAKMWGIRKNKPNMKYENFARSLRTYVTKGVLVKPKNKLVYKFTDKILY